MATLPTRAPTPLAKPSWMPRAQPQMAVNNRLGTRAKLTGRHPLVRSMQCLRHRDRPIGAADIHTEGSWPIG